MRKALVITPLKEELEAKYSQYGSTISQLAREYKTSNPTVRVWLKKYDIKTKDHIQASTEANNRKRLNPPIKELLERLYSNNSIDQLETIFNVGQQTIYLWLDKYDIKRKTLSEACKDGKGRRWESIIPNKDDFTSAYKELKCIKGLQSKFELSIASIRKLFKQYELEPIQALRSLPEIKLYNALSSSTSLKWDSCDRKVINPYELDLVCRERNLAVEYCGLYWHSEYMGEKAKDYHLKKLNACLEKGYDLITIFEYDNVDKVLSFIKGKLGFNTKVNARDCKVVILESAEAKAFNDTNHMHGHHGAGFHIGLKHNDELVQVLSMGVSRFNKSYEWECVRMTVKLNTSVIGGASKLFNHFIKMKKPSSMITYSDRRFGEGKVYENCGFKRVENSGPNYWYFHRSNPNAVSSRVTFQKHKLTEMIGYDPELTEWEIMKASKYDRIWDCGNSKYVWNK